MRRRGRRVRSRWWPRSPLPAVVKPYYFFPHFVSRISPIVPPEIVSPSTGLPRKMILVSSLYSFGPNLFHALHGASMRHSLNVLAVQVKGCLDPSSAKLGTVAPINNTNAINTVECRTTMASHKVEWHLFQKITNVRPFRGQHPNCQGSVLKYDAIACWLIGEQFGRRA